MCDLFLCELLCMVMCIECKIYPIVSCFVSPDMCQMQDSSKCDLLCIVIRIKCKIFITIFYMEVFMKYFGIFVHISKNIFHTRCLNNVFHYFSISLLISDFKCVPVCTTVVYAVAQLIFNVLKKILKNVLKHTLSTYLLST